MCGASSRGTETSTGLDAAAEYRSSWTTPTPTGGLSEQAFIDKTRLVFIEASPAVSFDLPGNVSLAAGYRATYALLERQQGTESSPGIFDFTLSGVNLTGFRLGAQWAPSKSTSLGLVYRHRIDTELKADHAVAGTYDFTDTTLDLTLPSKLGVGTRSDFGPLGLALDLEYGFNSQNDRSTLSGHNTLLDQPGAVASVFEWRDSVTARVGAEYLTTETIALRTGYIFDGPVSVKQYPSAFGTPPAPSHSVTLGGGYLAGSWQVNLATAYRFAGTEVSPADIPEDTDCATCSQPGRDYSLSLLGFYADVSVEL